MSGIFGALEIARKGLIVTQTGVRNAGQNIANVNTPGYSRQRVLQSSDTPIPTSVGPVGTGVRTLGIERITDRFIQSQLVRQRSAVEATGAQSSALSFVEEILNEQDAAGVVASLGAFYDALDDLATSSTPGQPAERAALVSTTQAAVDTLHSADSRLRELLESTDDGIRGLVPEVNSILQRIADLSQEIARIEVDELRQANDLRDQRELLTRDLAGLIDLQVREDADGGLSINLSNGVALLEGGRARTVIAMDDPTNPFDPSFAGIFVQDQSTLFDVTAEIGGGKLGGMLRARDMILPGALRSLDTVAYNLATTVNAVHNAGQGLSGAVGDFFTSLPQVEDSARDLSIAANILANPDDIAAGLTSGAGDNQNALALAALRDQAAPLFLPGDPPGPPSGPSRSVLGHAVAVAVDVGQQARGMNSALGQHERVMEGLENRREELSGVSVDEEATNLVKLQAAFQANARVITVVQGLLDDLVNLL